MDEAHSQAHENMLQENLCVVVKFRAGQKVFAPSLHCSTSTEQCKWKTFSHHATLLLRLLLFPKVVLALHLAVFTTLYGYAQPYKAAVANLIETVVNINFLLLLLLNATPFFYEDALIFPTPSTSSAETSCPGHVSGIAIVSWILMPFYYLPLLLFIALAVVFGTLHIRYQIEFCCLGPNV